MNDDLDVLHLTGRPSDRDDSVHSRLQMPDEASHRDVDAEDDDDRHYGSASQFADDVPVLKKVIVDISNDSHKWSHIDDLDSFYQRVYHYHRHRGFTAIILQDALELFHFLFTCALVVFAIEFVDYPVLFHNKLPDRTDFKPGDKILISDVVRPPVYTLFHSASALTWLGILLALPFACARSLALAYKIYQFLDIRDFFREALHLSDDELESTPWATVQSRLIDAQKMYKMNVERATVSELEISQRILRYKNFLVAMASRSVLPVSQYYTQGLHANLHFLFFQSPWAPFNQFHRLKAVYKRPHMRAHLVEQMQSAMALLAAINFICAPLILGWQLVHTFFSHADLVKRGEPGRLGLRRWSPFSRLFLRHYNELDHEFDYRMSRAYLPGCKYLQLFVSPLVVILARSAAFIAGSVLAILVVLTVWDEDVLNVEHVITIITALGLIVAVCRACIPDENQVYCPRQLFNATLVHIHYFPVDATASDLANSQPVIRAMDRLFPFTVVQVLYEIASPIVTPILLFTTFRSRASMFVDFFRQCTIEVEGVGNVCIHSQMQVRKRASSDLQGDPKEFTYFGDDDDDFNDNNSSGGVLKTEMSVVRFSMANPGWKPTADGREAALLKSMTSHLQTDVDHMEMVDNNALTSSLDQMLACGGVWADLARSTHERLRQGCRLDNSTAPDMVASMHGAVGDDIMRPTQLTSTQDRLAADMSLSVFYMHQLHRQHPSLPTTHPHHSDNIVHDNDDDEDADDFDNNRAPRLMTV